MPKKYKRKEEYFRILMSTVVDASKVHKCDKFEYMCAAMKTFGQNDNFIEIVSLQYDKRRLSNDPKAVTLDIDIIIAAHTQYANSEVGEIFNNVNRLLFNAQCVMPIVMKIKKGRGRIASCNTTVAKAYCVALKGVKGRLAFPNKESKRYFSALMGSACKTMPFRTMAYSLTHNAAYLTVCNFDGHKRSVAKMIDSVVDSYTAYYNKQFSKNLTNIFNGKSKVFNVDAGQIFNNIAQVNNQPILAGVSQEEVMEFSSHAVANMPTKLGLIAMYINTNLVKDEEKCVFVSDRKVQEHLMAAERNPENSVIIAGNSRDEDTSLYTLHFEEALYNHEIYDSSIMSAQELALVSLDMREVHGYRLDDIFNHSFNKHKDIEKVMVEIVYIQALHKGMSAAAIKRSLGDIIVSNGVLVSAMALINERKGYSFDCIAKSFGYSAEHPLLKNMVIDEVCVVYNITPVSAKMKLNLI